MGIADAFGREDRIEVKVTSFVEMTQAAAEAEVRSKLLMNAVKCEVPYRYIRETMTGVKESPEIMTLDVDRAAIDRIVSNQLREEESIEELPE